MKVLAGVLTLLISTTALADHGAIAYSPSTGQIGWANGRATRWSARRAAVNACGVGDCTLKVEERNEYGVIAKGANGRIAVAWNCDLFAAERDAVTACSAVDNDCRWRQWVRN